MRTLTTMHSEGIGVEKSWSRAAQWIRKAANKGDTMAMNTLAQFYEMGLGGMEKSDLVARQWVRKSAELGKPLGMFNLAMMAKKGPGRRKEPG